MLPKIHEKDTSCTFTGTNGLGPKTNPEFSMNEWVTTNVTNVYISELKFKLITLFSTHCLCSLYTECNANDVKHTHF